MMRVMLILKKVIEGSSYLQTKGLRVHNSIRLENSENAHFKSISKVITLILLQLTIFNMIIAMLGNAGFSYTLLLVPSTNR